MKRKRHYAAHQELSHTALCGVLGGTDAQISKAISDARKPESEGGTTITDDEEAAIGYLIRKYIPLPI